MHPTFINSQSIRSSILIVRHISVRSAFGMIACQLINQSFNAFVNYTNRNAMSDDPQDTDVIQQAFILATAASCAAALGFRKLFSGRGTLFTVNSFKSDFLFDPFPIPFKYRHSKTSLINYFNRPTFKITTTDKTL